MIHRFLNICKGGQGAQNSDTAWYYCSSEGHRTRDAAIEARRYLENVVATVEVVFDEEAPERSYDPVKEFVDKVRLLHIAQCVCPHCASGDVPTQRPDTKEWTHHNDITGGQLSPILVQHKFCLASHLRNSEYGNLING